MLRDLFAMWKNTAKSGKVYYTGKYNGFNLVGFTNTNKGDKLPYMRFYIKGDDTDALIECGAVWYHKNENKKAYLSGTIGKDTRITGFINNFASAENRQPALRFYVDDPDYVRPETTPETTPAVKPKKAAKKENKKAVSGDLPF